MKELMYWEVFLRSCLIVLWIIGKNIPRFLFWRSGMRDVFGKMCRKADLFDVPKDKSRNFFGQPLNQINRKHCFGNKGRLISDYATRIGLCGIND